MVILLQVLMVTKYTGTADGYWLYSYTVTGTNGYQTHRY